MRDSIRPFFRIEVLDERLKEAVEFLVVVVGLRQAEIIPNMPTYGCDDLIHLMSEVRWMISEVHCRAYLAH